MKKVLFLFIAVAVVVGFILLYNYLGDDGSVEPEPDIDPVAAEVQRKLATVSISLFPQGDSGQTGDALITKDEEGEKVKVSIDMRGFSPEPVQPARIHSGDCENIGEAVFPLTDLASGNSDTVLEISFDDLKTQPSLAIVISKSSGEPDIYDSCGEILAKDYRLFTK